MVAIWLQGNILGTLLNYMVRSRIRTQTHSAPLQDHKRSGSLVMSLVCPTPAYLRFSRARSCWRASRHTLYDVMSVWWAGLSHFVQVDKDPVAEAHKKEMEELRQV